MTKRAFNPTGAQVGLYEALLTGIYSEKGPLIEFFGDVYDITPPSPDLTGIEVSHMDSTDREYVDRELPEFGELTVNMAFNPQKDVGDFRNKKYWIEILWPVETSTPGTYHMWYMKAKFKSHKPTVSFEDRSTVDSVWTVLNYVEPTTATALST